MKTLSLMLFSLSMSVAAAANAGSFNDRGDLFATVATPGSAGMSSSAAARSDSHNGRGALFALESSAGHGLAVCPLDGTPASNGFTGRGEYFVASVDTDSQPARDGRSYAWAGDGHVTRC